METNIEWNDQDQANISKLVCWIITLCHRGPCSLETNIKWNLLHLDQVYINAKKKVFHHETTKITLKMQREPKPLCKSRTSRSIQNWLWLFNLSIVYDYLIVVSSNTCYYSENQRFVQRSQYIRTENPLHKQSEKAKTCH